MPQLGAQAFAELLAERWGELPLLPQLLLVHSQGSRGYKFTQHPPGPKPTPDALYEVAHKLGKRAACTHVHLLAGAEEALKQFDVSARLAASLAHCCRASACAPRPFDSFVGPRPSHRQHHAVRLAGQ